VQSLHQYYAYCLRENPTVKIYGYDVEPRCNLRRGWGKDILDQKSTDESVKDEGGVGCVLD